MSNKSKNSTYQQMSQHVQSWKQQKLSRKLYCQQNDLSLHKFHYWVLKLFKEEKSSSVPKKTKGFTKIPQPVAVSTMGPTFQVELTNGNRINFYGFLTPELYQLFL